MPRCKEDGECNGASIGFSRPKSDPSGIVNIYRDERKHPRSVVDLDVVSGYDEYMASGRTTYSFTSSRIDLQFPKLAKPDDGLPICRRLRFPGMGPVELSRSTCWAGTPDYSLISSIAILRSRSALSSRVTLQVWAAGCEVVGS
ncbi:hypothetical protein E1B28_011754 [Marasmius oreades]|uniref:Uncharacterized protein n=1 Tax=Marasmius oreades TaxID=181124 RepID=A0A9P7RUR4_9AGAR|nr:uncharacterized protein E1B28_011754 [Marasmius oreades]KAG7090146.1 hypothetical protein E1B28_011754 [Marasmius oreades]